MEAQNPYRAPVTPAATNVAKTSTSLKDTLFSFDGRITRTTYWLYSIAVIITYLVVSVIIGVILGAVLGQENGAGIGGIITMIIYIPVLWASLALQIKRWHDRDKSGWWCLINFVPIIGGIWAFIEVGCLRGTIGPNQYGPDPV